MMEVEQEDGRTRDVACGLPNKRRSFLGKEDRADEPNTSSIKILEIAHILQQKVVFLTGGKDRDGHPLLICLESPLITTLADEEFTKAIAYIKHMSNILWEKSKFVVLVSRQSDKWSGVKLILQKLEMFAPEDIFYVLVIKPQGFFQRHFRAGDGLMNPNASKHKVIYIDNRDALADYIDKTELPSELDGLCDFDITEWIEHSTAVERFQQTCQKIRARVSEVRVAFSVKVPHSSVANVDHVAASQSQLVHDVEGDIECATEIADTLKPIVVKPVNFLRNAVTALAKYNVAQLQVCLEQLQKQTEELRALLKSQEIYYEQAKELCKFEEAFGELSIKLMEITSEVEARTDIGDSLLSAQKLLTELNEFEERKKAPYTEMVALKERGTKMLVFFSPFARPSLKIRVDEIKSLCQAFDVKLEGRRDLLQTCLDVYKCLDQLQDWCKSGVDLLASQSVDHFNTAEGAAKCQREIDNFMKNANGISLKKMNQIEILCRKLENPKLNDQVKEVLARTNEVKEMFTKREASLKKMLEKPDRPVQPVQPVQALVVNTSKTFERLPKTSRSSPDTPVAPAVKKEEISIVITDDLNKNKRNRTFRKSLRASRRRPGVTPSQLALAEYDEDPEHRKKIRHVITELINTEQDYVNDLKCIIDGYYKPFDDPKYKIAPDIRSRKNILFGNLEDICDFHFNVFMKELEACKTAPYMVGHVFIEKTEEFQLYASYCKNKPKSEILQKELENTQFLKDCQQRLGHVLPLGSYLLKPVQRVTKYRLLLTEALKYVSRTNPAYECIMDAVQTMNRVLKHVNDVMHSSGLVGFPGNLDEQGKLLLQDAFVSWLVRKKSMRPITKVTGKNRQVFLFEKVIIFSKKDVEGGKDVGTYQFKALVKTEGIGLTETVKGDMHRFEIWTQGREEVHIMQAQNMEVKINWLTEVKKLLVLQFEQAREHATSGTSKIKPGNYDRPKLTTGASLSSSTPDVSLSDSEKSPPSDLQSPPPSVDSLLRRRFSYGAATKLDDVESSSLLNLRAISAETRSSSDTRLFTEDRAAEESSHNNIYLSPVTGPESNLDSDEWSNSEFDDDDESDACSVQTSDSDRFSLRSPIKEEPDVPQLFVAVVAYDAVESTELSFRPGDVLEFVKVGKGGWWLCQHQRSGKQGWVPATGYLVEHELGAGRPQQDYPQGPGKNAYRKSKLSHPLETAV